MGLSRRLDWDSLCVAGPDHGLPVLGEFDAIVAGGGAAGVAAAETLGRLGHDVLLIERYGFCGGNAVAGLSGTICGLYLSSERNSNRPEQAVFGFAERFREAMDARGGITQAQRYGRTWTHCHDPLVWRETADAFLGGAKVNLLYHCIVCGVVMEEDAVRGVIVESKAGRAVALGKVVVDASGDADIVYRAGYGYTRGQDGTVQNPTMIFRIGNVDMDKFLASWGSDTICSAEVTQALVAANASGKYDLPRAKIWIFPTPRANELLVNATRLVGRDGRELYPADPQDLTEAELVGRYQVREYARFLRDHVPGCGNSFVNDTGVQAGIRQSRSIAGVGRLANDDVVARRKRPDGVVRSPWPIELHSGEKPKLEWLDDDYYEVAYDTLIPERGENLIVAGRCISAEHEALASCRVTAQCFGYGHAAGLAAAHSIASATRLRDIGGEAVRAMLNEDGARLDD